MTLLRNPNGSTVRPFGSPRIVGDWRVTAPFHALDSAHPTPHSGLDLADGRCGEPVYAPIAGKVLVDGIPSWSGGAVTIRIDDGAGLRVDLFHSATEIVHVGQVVAAGERVGTVGSTGNSTACHIHLGVKVRLASGLWVLRDPWPRLAQNNVALNGAGINVRTAPTVSAAVYASSRPDGIFRKGDGAKLGPLSLPMYVYGYVTGGPWEIAGVKGNAWAKVKLDGQARYIAKPLIHSLA
jgi:murein DD-endopeptidase MepM/ murein hydrolase activator NlpD